MKIPPGNPPGELVTEAMNCVCGNRMVFTYPEIRGFEITCAECGHYYSYAPYYGGVFNENRNP